MTPVHSGQWVAVWGDERNGNRDIYAQNIHTDGSMGPGAAANGKLQGFVRDATTNVAIDAATIYAANADDSFQTSQTPFGSHYSFMIPEGVYNLSCEATGYQTAEATEVIVEGDQNTQYSFYLMPVDQITGTGTDISNQPRIYPNPFINMLNITIPGTDNQILNVQIRDVQGRVLKNFSPALNEIQLDVSNINAGFYYYTIQTINKQYTGKIIKY